MKSIKAIEKEVVRMGRKETIHSHAGLTKWIFGHHRWDSLGFLIHSCNIDSDELPNCVPTYKLIFYTVSNK
uniref:Ovule protein n=1 Tax=Steinernema glaseri TaxID=37863 RepID=A0A1I8AHF5_9BILA